MIRSMKGFAQARALFSVALVTLLAAYSLNHLNGLRNFLGARSFSQELLYSADSPFSRILNQSKSTKAFQTDAVLQTANNPFGIVSFNGNINSGSFSHRVSGGETLASIWQLYSSDKNTLASAIRILNEQDSRARTLKKGEEVSVTTSGGEIVSFRRQYDDGSAFSLIWDDQMEDYAALFEHAQIVERERVVTGSVERSFSASADTLDIPYGVVDDFVDLFSNRIEFNRDFQPGDTFSVSYTERVNDYGKVVGTGAIKTASVMIGGKFYAAVGNPGKDGEIRYFDENGKIPGDSFLRYPLQFTRISSVFSTARFHPVLNVSRPHNGVDFSAPRGTPVRTVGDGIVVYSGYSKTTGNMVRIQHDTRYTTEYMHLDSISSAVKKGAKISRGSLIGTVGSTGLSTGPHLHFGLFDRGVYTDPLKTKIFKDTPEEVTPSVVLAALEQLRKSHASMILAKREAASSKQTA